MSIEKFSADGKNQTIQTTGAIFSINSEQGTISIKQRIGADRDVAVIDLPKELKKAKGPRKEGFDYYWDGTEESQMIISGDSVVRFKNIRNLQVSLKFTPEFKQIDEEITKYKTGGLLALDGKGGIAIVPPSYASNEKYSKKFENNQWIFSGSDSMSLLFVGILPPRYFDWEKSFINVVHYSSHVQRYPTDQEIAQYSKFAKILELHSWVWENRHVESKNEKGEQIPLWDDLSYEAQAGKWLPDNEEEFKRVINTAHRYGMKVLPYVGTGSGEFTSETYERYLEEIKRIKVTYSIDGIYSDGLFYQHPEYGYFAARELREIFGEDGWLTLHDTHDGGYWAPFINTYMDSLITSEHNNFNQWTSTSYNISNSIAMLWPEINLEERDGIGFLKKLVDDSIHYNNRIVFMCGLQGQWRFWRLYFTDKEMEFIKNYYFEKIDELRKKNLIIMKYKKTIKI
ncbi:MAG: hypothetical protein WCX69_00650 [Candidatus Paceibacterota bacterium]